MTSLVPERTSLEAVRLTTTQNQILVTAPEYTLAIERAVVGFERAPYAVVRDRDGERWMSINLLSSVHSVESADEVWQVDGVLARQDGDDVVLTVSTSSTAWNSHTMQIRCRPATIELAVTIEGSGRLTDVTVFGGTASRPGGATGLFRSRIDFASVLVPTPTEPVRLVRPAESAAVLGVVGDADPGRLNAIFSPPPLVFGLGKSTATSATDVPDGDWIGLSVRDDVKALTFTTLGYEPLDGGFLLRLAYEGHTAVSGSWTSPTFVLKPARDGWAVIDDHRLDLAAHGHVARAGHAASAWWLEPIFCGWGAQCARAVHQLHAAKLHTSPDPFSDTLPETAEEEDEIARAAPALASQAVYDEFLTRLDEHELHAGTIVIDDRWQAEYGTATPDDHAWPDLKAWIAQRHANGQKVLLWWKAWDPEGLPLDECVLDAAGRAVAVDPGSDAYLRRLRSIVHRLLSSDGLDADGFKVDFTQRVPSGRTLRSSPGSSGIWGIAALHRLLSTLYEAAKQAKPDALVICHAVHASFSDVCDMVRLNDVLKFDANGARVPVADQLAFRAEIARRTIPQHPIDTDQWPMPSRSEWLAYAMAQPNLGVPALYYLESIDRSGEHIESSDLNRIAQSWAEYRKALHS